MKKLIVEARLNEFARKSGNPHVPYSADEIAAAAVDACGAGAAIAHFHVRLPDGSEGSEPDSFARVIRAIRAECPMLVHPTLGRFDQGAEPDLRLSSVASLATDPALRPDIAPLDLGSVNLDRWDPAARRFVSDDKVYVNTAADLRAMAARLRSWSIRPQLVLWNLAAVKLMRAMLATGDLAGPVYPAFLLAGEDMLYGHPANIAGLRAYLDAMEGIDCEWTVIVSNANYLPLLGDIIAAGGHVAIGLGDHPYSELGQPTNADLIARVAEAASAAGREIATPGEAREMLAISPAPVIAGARPGGQVRDAGI